MTTATVIALVYFVLLILLALWGLKWHRMMLRLIRERMALAEAEDNPRLVTVGLANTLRYHYRILEAYATIAINLLGIWLILAIPAAPPRNDLNPQQVTLTLIYTFALLPVLVGLVGFSGFLSFVDVQLWKQRPSRLRDLPWRRPSRFFVE